MLAQQIEVAAESNPMEYWKLLECLKQTNHMDRKSDSPTSHEEWYNDFKHLLIHHQMIKGLLTVAWFTISKR